MATVKRTTRETPDQAFEHFDIHGFTDTRPSENRKSRFQTASLQHLDKRKGHI